MATRWVYRAVEDALSSRVKDEIYPHTRISRNIRYTLRELKDFAKIYSVRCICLSNLHSAFPESLKSSFEAYSESMSGVLQTIPYLEVKPVKVSETLQKEREEAVEKFKKLLAAQKNAKQEQESHK